MGVGSMCLGGESVMGGESGVGTWETGRGRGLATRGIAVPCAVKGAPCEGCWGLDAPCCPSPGAPAVSPGAPMGSPGAPTACHADRAACAAAQEASDGQVEADDQKASGDQ